ncbi:transposase [Streptomyces caniferus]|uniref:transposase n=1 Tax=Streptomyces caniferus TaxID=285557 RepID=UPI0035313A1D
MPRHARLTDRHWDRSRPLLPSSTGRRGRPWADHRRIVEVLVYRYRTGIPWRDLPAGFGSWKTVWPVTAAGPPTGPGTACSVSCSPARTTTG